jgi:hypothetical protein
MMVRVDNIAYTSPIDGRAITTKQQRIEDLKRNSCIEYDPEMKTDHQRRLVDGEKQLDKQVDEHIDRTVASMDSRQREKLTAELAGGLTVEPVRKSVNG